jgi:TonB family protein
MLKGRAAGLLLFGLAACAHAANDNEPRELDESEIKLDLTAGPQWKGLNGYMWPLSAEYRNREGWVDLHFMIDTSGKTYEIAVTDSTGDEAFRGAALKAAKKWHFEPATFAGEPTETGYHLRLYFAHTYDRSARPQLMRAYKAAVAAIDAGDRPRAEAALENLVVHNLYEDAFASFAKYQFEAKWGTEAGQISALRRALATARWPQTRPRDLFATATQALLMLELRAKDFSSALYSWDSLKALKPEQARASGLQPKIDDVIALRKDDRAYSVQGEIAANMSSWFYSLYKHRFQVVVASGRVSEIKLRCDRHYVSFGYDATLYYRIAEQYGDCGLELVGDPGTSFELIQS